MQSEESRSQNSEAPTVIDIGVFQLLPRGRAATDREVVEQIVASIRAKNYGLRTLVHEIVQSRVFLNK